MRRKLEYSTAKAVAPVIKYFANLGILFSEYTTAIIHAKMNQYMVNDKQ